LSNQDQNEFHDCNLASMDDHRSMTRAKYFVVALTSLSLGISCGSKGRNNVDAALDGDGAPLLDGQPLDASFDAPYNFSDAGPSSGRYIQHKRGETSLDQGFWEYLPAAYGSGAKFPLLIFLHGLGENGDGTTQLGTVNNTGLPQLIKNNQWPATRPFIVLAPQNSRGGCHLPDDVHNLLVYAVANYRVDPQRIYITGLSCGGIGTFNYLGKYLDEYVVAAVPIAGDGRGAIGQRGCDLGKVAIWAFHGDADPTVSPAGSTEPMGTLANCPSPPRREAKLTIFPGEGHFIWPKVYDGSAGHDIYAWLLTQHR
jgi:predicted esterase